MEIHVNPPLPTETIFINLNLDEAINDTPKFRVNVRRFEEQVDHFEKWLELYLKSLKHFIEESIKFIEASNVLAKRSIPSSSEDALLDHDFTLPAARIFADTFQTTLAFKQKLVNDIDEKLIQPLLHFTKTDLKDFKDARRNYDRALERYESMLAKYTSQSKNKEASALREVFRKTYIRVLLDYTLKAIHFRTTLDHLLMEQYLNGTSAHLEFHEASLTVYKSTENRSERLKGWLWERKLTKYTDSSNFTLMNNQQINETSIQPNRPPSIDLPSPSIMPSKQGYLFMRTPSGKNTWTRKYLYLKDGMIWWSSIVHGKHRSISVGESEKIDVLLCETRIDTSQDRRFCFEIVYGAKQTTWLLQAETEEELKEWINVFESAKRYAFPSTISHKEQKDENSIKNEEDVVKQDDSNKSLSSNTVENNNITEKSSTDTKPAAHHNTLTTPSPTFGADSSSMSTTKKRAASISTASLSGDKNATTPSANQQHFWGTIQWALPAVNLIMNTVNGSEGEDGDVNAGRRGSSSALSKGGRSRSVGGPVGFGVDGSIAVYPQSLLLHNVQLHLFFQEMLETEFVLDVYQCAWQKDDTLLKGRVYLTQDRFYFYSLIMSVVNMFSIRWKDIKFIKPINSDFQQVLEISVKNEENKYIVKSFFDTRSTFSDKINLIWKLAIDEKQKTLQEKFNSVWNIKSAPKSKIEGYKLTLNNDNNIATSTANNNASDSLKNVTSQLEKLISPQDFNKNINNNSLENSTNNDNEDLPSNIPQPRGPIRCACTNHLEKLEAEIEYPVSAKKLFDMIFDEKSTLWSRLHHKKGNILQHSGPWVIDNSGEGERKREFRYIIPINNPAAKVKESECVDVQVCQKREEYL
ncbi:19128_t:CDS:10 [Entrophospora sp. SA101]|nr:19128_t:CDS:10 [Entrophospora sp. SA101]